MTAASWSPWHPLSLSEQPQSPAVLAEILDGGQAFRWHCVPPTASDEETWIGGWTDHVTRVRWRSGAVEWSALEPVPFSMASAVATYFAAEEDFAALSDLLPWRSDPHLAACIRSFPGLRLLRQPFGETLLAFLCSATKQIVQIKQMLALLAERHGPPIADFPGRFHRLPTWSELASVTEAELRACLFGFRARFIRQTAEFLEAHPGWLDETELLPYPQARARLVTLPGVGEKIADCVLLFGAGRLEAFPVDVWILKAMAARYGLTHWKPSQLAQFGRVHFGPLAGLAQQYLFAGERGAQANH